MQDGDAVVGLDQLSVAVPASRDVAGEDLTVQLQGLAQLQGHVLQILEDLQGLHWNPEKTSKHLLYS